MKNLEIIAFFIDLARQKERVEFVKEQMRFCKQNGYNTVILYLEASVRTSVTPFFDEESSYSLSELAEMVNYGESAGLDIIPAFETLSHMEKFFVYDELACLSEFNDEQKEGRGFSSPLYKKGSHGCATNPELQTFTDAYVKEVCSVFHSKYVHLGMDEMFQFACCDRCRQIVEKTGKSKLFSDFILHARELVTGMGREMMIWDDMFEYYDVIDSLPRDIIFCNWNYIFVGNYPKGKWTGRKIENPFYRYDRLGFKYLFCCKAGNLSQTFNIETFTAYSSKFNPIGAILTSWERSDCFYPCLEPVTAYAGRKWSGGLHGESDVGVFSEFLSGNEELSRAVIELYAPDFVVCRTDVTSVAESDNHVIAMYRAKLKTLLDLFEKNAVDEKYRRNDVFTDLYSNVAVQYVYLSLSALSNEVFNDYEVGGIRDLKKYSAEFDKAEKLVALIEDNGNGLWQKYRRGIVSYGNAWGGLVDGLKNVIKKARKDVADAVGKKSGVLYLYLMLPDTYSSIRSEISVRYAGDKKDTIIFSGSTKPCLTMFDVSGEYELRFSTLPKKIEYVVFSAFGEGEQFPVYVKHFDGEEESLPVGAEVISGNVEKESNVLRGNSSFAIMGVGDGLAHLNDLSLSKQKHTVKINLL